jgi:hypothetical protein
VDSRFLRDLARHSERPRTVLVVDDEGSAPPRQYLIHPRRLFAWAGAGAAILGVLLAALVVLSPVRQLVYGPDPEVLRETARLNAMRAGALADSLALQREYLAVLRATLIGAPDSVIEAGSAAAAAPPLDLPPEQQPLEVPVAPRSEDWADHDAPALALSRLDADPRARAFAARSRGLPRQPPVPRPPPG